MAETKWTPGPLRLARDTYNVLRIWDAQLDCDVASTEGDGSIPSETRKANAERIVQCWNSHDALCEALEATLAHAALFNRDSDDMWLAVKNLAESVLAAARGEKS